MTRFKITKREEFVSGKLYLPYTFRLKDKDIAPEDFTTYELIDPIPGPKIVAECHKNSCFFCKKCTDVFWDYTNGPYMIFCEDEHETIDGVRGKCVDFEREEKTNGQTT